MAVQEYTPTLWEDAPSSETPINAENLNHIESGIVNATGAIQGLENSAISMQDVENKIYEIVDGILGGNNLTVEYFQGAAWLTYTNSNDTVHPIANVSSIIQSETAGKFVPAQTISSLDDATEAGKLYLYDTDYYFNVIGTRWTQYKIAYGAISYRNRLKINNVWGAWTSFTALETTDSKVSAITDNIKASTTHYTSVKAIVDYIAAQG